MKFKLIKGKEMDLAEKLAYDEFLTFCVLIKKYLLRDLITKKVVDISCFYNIHIDDLTSLVNRIGG